MTEDEILNMPAGKKIDQLIELYVFSWPKGYDDANDIPNYSTDIATAFEVAKKLTMFQLNSPMLSREYWAAWAWRRGMGHMQAKADTPELAICRAALLLFVPLETDEKLCAACGHSESRHQTAGGFCKHCTCNAFVGPK